jgi:hypothetical protein
MPDNDSLNWVECSKCKRWELFENTGIGGKYSAVAVAKVKFVCRLCEGDHKIKELQEENKELRVKISALEETQKGGTQKYSEAVKGAVEKEGEQIKSDLMAIMDTKVKETKEKLTD